MSDPADHITCQEVVELVNDYLEGELHPNEVALFEEHLNFCDGCAVYVDQLRITIETLGTIAEQDVPPEAREQLMSAFRDWKRR